jgi:hypothetical protein
VRAGARGVSKKAVLFCKKEPKNSFFLLRATTRLNLRFWASAQKLKKFRLSAIIQHQKR